MKIGVVDLDTSHPKAWIPIERELGHEVVGVWDGGDVHPAGYAEEFAQQLGVPRVYGELSEMVPEVDCAILHGCNWDMHLPKARPFLEAGKAVLLDKPMAGNMADLSEFRRLAEAGARIAGGSSLRFCAEAKEFLARPVEERGTPHTVFAGCGVDEFNYGIHAYALLSAVLGAGAVSVHHLGAGPQRRLLINYTDNRAGVLAIGAVQDWLPFYATVVTDRSVAQLVCQNDTLYRMLLESVLPYLSGAQARPPLSMDDLIEPELCALAARMSWEEGDREVRLEELATARVAYDGREFAAGYRKQRYPDAS